MNSCKSGIKSSLGSFVGTAALCFLAVESPHDLPVAIKTRSGIATEPKKRGVKEVDDLLLNSLQVSRFLPFSARFIW